MGLFFASLSLISLLVIYPLELGLVDVSSEDPFKILREKAQDGTVLDDISLGTSAKKLREGSAGMWILCACCWLYSGIAIGIISKLQNKMQKPSKADKNQGMDSVSQMFTVKLDALPKT